MGLRVRDVSPQAVNEHVHFAGVRVAQQVAAEPVLGRLSEVAAAFTQGIEPLVPPADVQPTVCAQG